MNIEERIEPKRGCGFRKPGGLYLVSGALSRPCGLFPIKVETCPCCGQGVRPARGWTWVSNELLLEANCERCDSTGESRCHPFGWVKRFGLLWIGEKFYSNPEEFSRETLILGVSRRIAAVPKDFEVGKTWILLGHRKAYKEGDELVPGLFGAFRPSAIEYVVKGTETEEELERLVKRGITLVRVTHSDREIFRDEA